jgi:alginate O-acetyltransferase complex protein AlgI
VQFGPSRPPGQGVIGHIGWAAKVVGMFHLTCVGWLIFRAPSMDGLVRMLVSVVTEVRRPTEAQIVDGLEVLFFSSLLLVVQALQIQGGRRSDIRHLPAWVQTAVLVLMFYSLVMWGQFGASPFIYFQF